MCVCVYIYICIYIHIYSIYKYKCGYASEERHGQASGVKPHLFRGPGRAKFALPIQNCTTLSHKQPKILKFVAKLVLG